MASAIICSQSDIASDYRIQKMAHSLRGVGYDVRFVTRSHPKKPRRETADTHVMKLLFWHGPLFYAELNLRLFWHLLWGKKADLVVSIDLDTLAACAMATAFRRTRLMFDSHEYFPEVPEIAHKPVVKWVWNRVQDVFVRFADVHVTVCQSIADVFKQRYGLRFHVVRNVPLAGRTQITQRPPSEPHEGLTLLYQGAVNVGRGIEETLRAMAEVDGVRLIIVGDGDVMADVRALVDSLSLGDRVEIAGWRNYAELPQFMARADVGLILLTNICMNYYFALPNRTFDFIQAGLPILGIDFPEIARVVRGADVGLCVGSLTTADVAQALREILAHPEWRERWRGNMAALAPSLTWEQETVALMDAVRPNA